MLRMKRLGAVLRQHCTSPQSRCSTLTEVTQIGRVDAVRGSVPRVAGLNFHIDTAMSAQYAEDVPTSTLSL